MFKLFLKLFFALFSTLSFANDFTFDSKMLGLESDQDIDLSKFEDNSYIYPGNYNMSFYINNRFYNESVNFSVIDEYNKSSLCLNNEIIDLIPLNESSENKIIFNNSGCFELSSLPGTTYSISLSQQKIELNIPQYYLQYSSETWDPPKLWSEGITGLILDYNFNVNHNKKISGNNSQYLNGFGVTGFNIDSWRFRAEWQTNYNKSDDIQTNKNFKWQNIYAYKALKNLRADLLIGESYLNTDTFSSFNYTGISIFSNDEMLSPNLRYYAPEITGVANTNALVTVSQLGRTIYSSQVPAGSFTLRDLPNYTSGILDVKVEEQDGTVQNFQVDAIAAPYLTRPGQIRYKATLGQPRNEHNLINETFFAGEISYGLNNKTSLIGGLLANKNYQNINLGIGQDLNQYGAFAFTMMQSVSKERDGSAVRLNYNKYFDNTRLSATTTYYNKDYQDFSSYLNEYYQYVRTNSISLQQAFPSQKINFNVSYSDNKQKDSEKNKRVDLTLNKYFDIGNYKNINASLSAYKNFNQNDYGAYVRFSFPLQTSSYLTYSANTSKNSDYISNWTYSNSSNKSTNYSISAGQNGSNATFNTFLTHRASNGTVNFSASYIDSQSLNISAGLRGGLTVTTKGMDIHRMNTFGESRVIVDTDGVKDIPIKGYGIPIVSNRFGTAITPDVRNYYRNNISLDLNKLPENADAINTVKSLSITKGAIGYQHFSVISGQKGMVKLILPNNKYPSFGAEVFNEKGHQVGIVGESGNTFLIGLNPNHKMTIKQNDCSFIIPNQFDLKDRNNQFLCK